MKNESGSSAESGCSGVTDTPTTKRNVQVMASLDKLVETVRRIERFANSVDEPALKLSMIFIRHSLDKFIEEFNTASNQGSETSNGIT